MRILFLTDRFPPHSGGSRIYYYNLYRNLVSLFPDCVTVLTKKVPGWREFDQKESIGSLRIIRHFRPLETWKYYQLPKVLLPFIEGLRLIRREGIEQVHAGDLFPQGLAALWFKRLFGLPYLVYAHGDEICQTQKRRYQPAIRDLIYRSADAVIAENEFAYAALRRIGVAESRLYKITAGVDCDRFRPQPRNPALVHRFSLEGKLVLLTAARLLSKKGHKLAIQAVSRLVPEMPNLRYLIVGDGEERRNLEALTDALRLRDVVTFVGNTTHNQAADFYSVCDVFLMPNRQAASGDVDGLALVFLEAAAAGKPCVGGRCGGTPEAIRDGETGFLVDPDDVGELAARLRLLCTNVSLREQLGTSALRRARAEFSWKSRAERLREINTRMRADGGRRQHFCGSSIS